MSVSAASAWRARSQAVSPSAAAAAAVIGAPRPEQQPGDRLEALRLGPIPPQGREVEGHQVVVHTHRRFGAVLEQPRDQRVVQGLRRGM